MTLSHNNSSHGVANNDGTTIGSCPSVDATSCNNTPNSTPPLASSRHAPRPDLMRLGSYTSSRASQSLSQLHDRFAELRDAIYFSANEAGFILSADEKFAYPSVKVGQPPEDPVEIDDLETFFKGWDCWDEDFKARLPVDQYPVIYLSRNRKNYKGKRVGVLEDDGSRVIFEARGECIYAPGTRNFLGGVTWLNMLGRYEDVKKQQQEEALRSFETICDSLPHMVWTADADGYIDYFSKSWYEYTGRSVQGSMGHRWREALHPDDCRGSLETYEKALLFGTEQEVQFRYRRHDGVYRWMSSRARPGKDENGNVLKWYGTNTDIHEFVVTRDEARKLETENARLLTQEHAARESSRLKSQFLAHMSHELRTPISGIIGMVGLLRDTQMNVEQQDYADCIKVSAGNLLTIVNDILDFSKIESGKLQIEEIPFTLSSVVEDVGRVWTHIAQQKGLEFKTHSDEGLKVETMGDPTRIGQILSNLCSNALKFTALGSITYSTKIKEAEEGFQVEMVIEDSGIGIEEKTLASLFSPFRQGDTSTARLYGGTGLGLIISRNLAQLMGGELRLESVRGKGTKAILALPMKKAPPSTQMEDFQFQTPARPSMSSHNVWSSSSNPTTPTTPHTTSPAMRRPAARRIQTNLAVPARRPSMLPTSPISSAGEADTAVLPAEARRQIIVLIVEDNAINQRIAVKTVEKLGFSTKAASNGQEALDYLASCNDVDMCLMDCQMPVLDGYEATRRLRTEEAFINLQVRDRTGAGWDPLSHKRKRTMNDIPVIALTASAIPGDREKCYSAGMDDYLTKPLDAKTLERKLVKWSFGRPSEEGNGHESRGG